MYSYTLTKYIHLTEDFTFSLIWLSVCVSVGTKLAIYVVSRMDKVKSCNTAKEFNHGVFCRLLCGVLLCFWPFSNVSRVKSWRMLACSRRRVARSNSRMSAWSSPTLALLWQLSWWQASSTLPWTLAEAGDMDTMLRMTIMTMEAITIVEDIITTKDPLKVSFKFSAWALKFDYVLLNHLSIFKYECCMHHQVCNIFKCHKHFRCSNNFVRNVFTVEQIWEGRRLTRLCWFVNWIVQ